jgi:hypothetical protein
MKNKKGQIANLAGVSAIWGVHRQTVTAWVRKGCPFIQRADQKRGLDWEFDTAAVSKWRLDLAVANAVGETENVTELELNRRKLADLFSKFGSMSAFEKSRRSTWGRREPISERPLCALKLPLG